MAYHVFVEHEAKKCLVAAIIPSAPTLEIPEAMFAEKFEATFANMTYGMVLRWASVTRKDFCQAATHVELAGRLKESRWTVHPVATMRRHIVGS